jgi:acetyl esterase/lipase
MRAEEMKTVLVQPIWPGKPPGETKELPPEQDVTKPNQKDPGGRPIIRLTNVSIPTVSVYRPAKEKDTGASVIVCPGGGHHILAYNHEDFAMLIYPGSFEKKGDPTKMREDVTITKNAPPTFLVHAWDNPVTVFSSLHIATELRKAGVPAELHIYATGGHGYGMRDTGEVVNTWPQRAADWLKQKPWEHRPKQP